MKIKELKKLLEQCDDENEVVILADRGHATVGRSPSVNVKSVGNGFDWDAGLTQISPEEKLTVEDKTTEAAKSYFKKSLDFYMKAEMGCFNRNQVSRELKRFLEAAIQELKGK